jgi:lipoate-protein ligase A
MLFENILEVIDELPHEASLNMAIDEVLLRHAHMPLLRLYRWARPAISFGYFGVASQILPQCGARDAVRRWTGGGVVWHGEDLTYSIVVPRAAEFFRMRPLASYAAIHRCLGALIPGAVVQDAPDVAEKNGFCFVAPVQNDLTHHGRKIGGGAQRRTAVGLLHQGSVQAADPGVNVGVRAGFATALARNVRQRALTAAELAEAAGLAAEKYATRAWLWRR